jgi:hypothetical protein
MKYKLHIITAGVAAITLCTPAFALPRPKKNTSPSPSPSASAAGPAVTQGAQTAGSPAAAQSNRAIPFHGMISAVDARAKTFTIAGKEHTRTFKITNTTVVTKTGQAATIKDVVANEEARGSYWKAADGSLELKTLKVGPPTDQEKAAEEKRKQRRAEKKAAGGGASASPTASPAASASPSASPH